MYKAVAGLYRPHPFGPKARRGMSEHSLVRAHSFVWPPQAAGCPPGPQVVVCERERARVGRGAPQRWLLAPRLSFCARRRARACCCACVLHARAGSCVAPAATCFLPACTDAEGGLVICSVLMCARACARVLGLVASLVCAYLEGVASAGRGHSLVLGGMTGRRVPC